MPDDSSGRTALAQHRRGRRRCARLEPGGRGQADDGELRWRCRAASPLMGKLPASEAMLTTWPLAALDHGGQRQPDAVDDAVDVDVHGEPVDPVVLVEESPLGMTPALSTSTSTGCPCCSSAAARNAANASLSRHVQPVAAGLRAELALQPP